MLEEFHLGGNLLAAIYRHGANGRVLPKPFHFSIDLNRQLAGGNENDCLGGLAFFELAEERNGKRGGFKIRYPKGFVGSNPTFGTS